MPTCRARIAGLLARPGLLLLVPLLMGAASPSRIAPPSWFDPDHPWSVWKLLAFAMSVAVAWWACYHFLFQRSINTKEGRIPWPRDSFARSMAAFASATIVFFVAWFAGPPAAPLRSPGVQISLFPSDSSIGLFLNNQWLWITLLALSLSGHFVVFWMLKHRARSTR